MDEIEDLYKNYNILHLCNTFVDGLPHDDETRKRVKTSLKNLHDKCAYNYDNEA